MNTADTTFNVTRRRFIGAALAAIPVVRSLATLVKIPADEIAIVCDLGDGEERLTFHNFTNGDLEARINGRSMTKAINGEWFIFREYVNNENTTSVQARVPTGLDGWGVMIDWYRIIRPRNEASIHMGLDVGKVLSDPHKPFAADGGTYKET